MIDIKEMSGQELKQKIENIKAEREKTADALKRYEEELERRKQEVLLGVPLADKEGAPFVGVYELGFHSEKSFFSFSERFQNYVTATRDNAKGEPIDIKGLLPLMKKGWVTMDKNGSWCWYEEKPQIHRDPWNNNSFYILLSCFNIKPVENWETSLMECGL